MLSYGDGDVCRFGSSATGVSCCRVLKGVIRPAYALTPEVMKTNKGPDARLMIEGEELF